MTTLDDRIKDFSATVHKPGTQVAQGFYIAQQRALTIISDLHADNKRLREALGWYGDEDKYRRRYSGYGSSTPEVMADHGKIARKALGVGDG